MVLQLIASCMDCSQLRKTLHIVDVAGNTVCRGSWKTFDCKPTKISAPLVIETVRFFASLLIVLSFSKMSSGKYTKLECSRGGKKKKLMTYCSFQCFNCCYLFKLHSIHSPLNSWSLFKSDQDSPGPADVQAGRIARQATSESPPPLLSTITFPDQWLCSYASCCRKGR